jgi:hypothetical protein
MGLLDDAIREHLDLKRRRGADPAEIERAEQEALGPVRRAPEELEHPDLAPDEADEYEYEAEPEPGEPYDEDLGLAAPPEADFAPPAPRDPGPPITEEHFAEPEPASHEPELPAVDEPEPAAREPEAAPHESESPPPDPGDLSQETVEYEIEERHEGEERHKGEGHHEGEDVLEETPEFLQDTPEHDRLWFEQRPPRDFDFDP